jgi:hypothetical protein
MRKKQKFLEKFYDDQAKRTVMQCALAKAIKLDKKRKIKLYSEELNKLECEMMDYITRSKRLYNKINFTKEAPKYRIGEQRQKELTLSIIEKEMTIDELQLWVEGKKW